MEALISFLPTEAAGAIGAIDWPAEERKRLANESTTFVCSTCGPVLERLLPERSADEPRAVNPYQDQISQLHIHNRTDDGSVPPSPQQGPIPDSPSPKLPPLAGDIPPSPTLAPSASSQQSIPYLSPQPSLRAQPSTPTLTPQPSFRAPPTPTLTPQPSISGKQQPSPRLTPNLVPLTKLRSGSFSLNTPPPLKAQSSTTQKPVEPVVEVARQRQGGDTVDTVLKLVSFSLFLMILSIVMKRYIL